MTDKTTNISNGRKPNQKLKPYLVLQYLLRNSDEFHVVSAPQIVGYLQELGIDAERRSIYRDIDEINKAMLMVEQDMDLYEAEAELEEYDDENDTVRYIVYDKNKKGFYVRERRFEFDEIRLAAESIYASKFLTEKETETIVDLICSFVSDYQADQIRHEVFLTDRVKTNNKNTFKNISMINSAMSKELDGEKHIPEKISFKYLRSTINDLKQQVERRQGERYIVSPYALILNDGNYYLLAYDDKGQKIKTYRVDRMRDVRILVGQPREGANEFYSINLKTYIQRVFSMFEGKEEQVTIRFKNFLLDSVIDRFGRDQVKYTKVGEDHFSITTYVEISDQFFGWVCGYGDKAKITAPQRVVDAFQEYLENIKRMY